MRHPSLRILGLCHVLLLMLGGGLALLALSDAPSLLRPSSALLGSIQIGSYPTVAPLLARGRS